MTKISQKEFEEKWDNDVLVGGGRCYQFHLSEDNISEWKSLGKFKIVKEFCDSRNYEIFFCCMVGNRPEDRLFGFVFRNEDDADKLVDLVVELRNTHTSERVANVRVLGRKGIDMNFGSSFGCNPAASCPFNV